MALASGVTLEIETDRVRFLPGAVEYARLGAVPAASRTIASSPPVWWKRCANCRARSRTCSMTATSGGLLISLAEADAARLEQALEGAYRIGRVLDRGEKAIRLI